MATIDGTNEPNLLRGTNQADRIRGFAADDLLDGLGGDDQIFAGTGNDTVLGYTGNDRLLGEDGNDNLYGEAGNDRLLGGNGDDRLVGGNGNDTLTGGAGADRFIFNSLSQGIDQIIDFRFQEGDKIEISTSGFGATSTDQFFYNSSTGALTFDASSSDSIAPVQFASLEAGLNFIPSLDITIV